ncbi:uncharacterized protein V6R79_021227 [Siganus canaliculatus]
MDFFDGLQSTSQPAPQNGNGDAQMTDGTDIDSARGKSASKSVSDIQEQHTSTIIDNISRRAQDLVEKINDSRTTDQKLLDSFQEKIIVKVTEMCQQMKQHMYMVYEKNSSQMQVKLLELSEVLERCSKLDKELMEANQVLERLRQSQALSQMSES